MHTGLMDFRTWLHELERTGHLVRIADEIDPLTEAGAIMRLANERKSPAQWFTNPKGCMPGATLLGGPFATKERIAMAFGLPADVPHGVLTDIFAEAIHGKRIKPIVVPHGVCQENVLLGDDVDLSILPVAKLHPQDGGPYIGTLNIGVCKDLDSDWVNWGTYRGMVHDKRSTGLWLGPLNQGGQILRKYHAQKKVMEYVMFFGGDPMHNIIASCGVPPRVSEVDVVGGIRGEAVRLVKCKTVDLHVPDNAEIVLEGTVSPGDEKAEGPFGEYPGYIVSGSNPRPVFRVSALTFRNNPILPTTCLGVPVDDSMMWVLEVASSVKEALRAKGVPIIDVAVPEFSGCHAVVVSTKTPHAGIPQLIASVTWTDRNGSYFPYVIVVDDDVDPWNLGEVFHAMCTKCNPIRDIHIYPGYTNSPLTPYIAGNPLREFGAGGGNVLLDCTWPIEWTQEQRPHRLAFENTYPEAVKEKVLANFVRWGLQR
ncbi:MAG TPA: UbiD family decarboxylase [Rugosibacter sp.]